MANDVLQLPAHMPLPMPSSNAALPPPVQPPENNSSVDATARAHTSGESSIPQSPTIESRSNTPIKLQAQQDTHRQSPQTDNSEGSTRAHTTSSDLSKQQPAAGLQVANVERAPSEPKPITVPVSLIGSASSQKETQSQERPPAAPESSNQNKSPVADNSPSMAEDRSRAGPASTQEPIQVPPTHLPQASSESASNEAPNQASNQVLHQREAQKPMPGQESRPESHTPVAAHRAASLVAIAPYQRQSADANAPPPYTARRVVPIAPTLTPKNVVSSPSIGSGMAIQPVQSPEQQGRPGFEHPECANCKTTKTPLWRRGPNGQNLCNACGLYVKARNINRPVTLKRSPVTRMVPLQSMMGSCPGDGRCNGTGGSESCPQCPSFNNNRLFQSQDNPEGSAVNMVSCQNCGTITTPLWRRDSQGHIICNACGLYNRIHKDSRPSDLRASVIKRRRRNTQASSDSSTEESSRQSQGQPLTKLSQPPSPDRRPQHTHSPRSSDELCCEHISPALQPPQQYPAPLYNGQGSQGPAGSPGHYGLSGPHQSQHQHQKPGSVPYGYFPMGQSGQMGLPMMLPPPGPGYVGQPWPIQPPPMGSQYQYPPPMPMPAQGPPPSMSFQQQHEQHQALAHTAGSHQGTPLPVSTYQGPEASRSTPRQSVSPHGTPQSAQERPPASQEPLPSSQQAAATRIQQHSLPTSPQHTPESDRQPAEPAQHSRQGNQRNAPASLGASVAASSETQISSASSQDNVANKLAELRRGSNAAPPDSSDSPLAVLHYLKGASQDTISEYLLAAQRQLNDKVYQLRRSLGRAEFQLKECEDALKEINKNGP